MIYHVHINVLESISNKSVRILLFKQSSDVVLKTMTILKEMRSAQLSSLNEQTLAINFTIQRIFFHRNRLQ